MATRMLYPSLLPPRAMQTSVSESAALLTAARPTMAKVSRMSVSTNADGTRVPASQSQDSGVLPQEVNNVRDGVGLDDGGQCLEDEQQDAHHVHLGAACEPTEQPDKVESRFWPGGTFVTVLVGRQSSGQCDASSLSLAFTITPMSRGPDPGDFPRQVLLAGDFGDVQKT